MSSLKFTMNLNEDPSSLEDVPDSYQELVTGQLSIMDGDQITKLFEATSGFPIY